MQSFFEDFFSALAG